MNTSERSNCELDEDITPASSHRGGSPRDDAAYRSKSPSAPSIDASLVDERSRLEHKIEKLREEITRSSIAREGDIEEYLKITNAIKNKPENPQMARIRQHFEKKNKKYTHDTEQLQKKLELFEQRLEDLENGVLETSLNRDANTQRLFHNVGHGIKRNLREMTGNVIAAPLDIAQRMKKNMFGSADNIPIATTTSGRGNDESSVGMSTFYDQNRNADDHNYSSSQSDRGRNMHEDARPSGNEVEQPPPRIRLDSIPMGDDLIHHGNVNTMAEQLREIRQHYAHLQKSFDAFKRDMENEMRNQQTELVNSRFRTQHLEHTLNETMELHQNEVKQLKNDLNLIGARMDYQYNDRFKKIEESVEASQNRLYRMEASWHENSERLLQSGQNMWNALMLSGANIVVELLKIALYLISVVLDSIKPITGTRKRTGIVIIAAITIFFLWNFICSHIFTTNPSLPANSEQQ